jgi:NAD(P)H-dependent FMN reductase
MKRLLIVHHTVSPSTSAVLDSIVEGARDRSIEGVDVVLRPALTASALDALEADGYLIAGPVNLGYLAGAVKHFFDTVYYPCLDTTAGRPYAAVLHAGGPPGDPGRSDRSSAEGALRALDSITTGLRWKAAQKPLVVSDSSAAELAAAKEVGSVMAALLSVG